MPNDLPPSLQAQAEQTARQLIIQMQRIGDGLGSPDLAAAYREAVEGHLRTHLTRGAAAPPDGRAAPWLVRVRLYEGDSADPQADTDPELAVDASGTWQVNGLPQVALHVRELILGYHAPAPVAGLDKETLERGIRGVRPTISRHGGWAAWRLPYAVNDTAWLARVDLCRG